MQLQHIETKFERHSEGNKGKATATFSSDDE